jgi:lipoprotein-anchoring transpeptidase ErfK/SrfK
MAKMSAGSSRAKSPKETNLLSYVLLGGTALVLMACAVGGLAPGLAAPEAVAAGPRSVSWAYVEISKPTPTALPEAPAATVVQNPDEVHAEPAIARPPAITMRIVDESEAVGSAPSAAPVATNGKSIVVSIREQHLYAYENGELVYSFVASTGEGNSTRVGTFHVQDKIPNAYGATWNIWMPDWLGIYWSGTLENGIHALPILPGGARLWSGFLGTPISYGCVVLGVNEAMQLYDWAEIGTPVEIRY